MTLPHEFDLLFDIKTAEQLDEEMSAAFKKFYDLAILCDQHNVDVETLPKFKQIVDNLKI